MTNVDAAIWFLKWRWINNKYDKEQ